MARDTIGLRSYSPRAKRGRGSGSLTLPPYFPTDLLVATLFALSPISREHSSLLVPSLFARNPRPVSSLALNLRSTRSRYPSRSMIYNQRRSFCKQKRPRYLRFYPCPAANLRLLPGASSLKIHRAVSLFQFAYKNARRNRRRDVTRRKRAWAHACMYLRVP